MDENGDWYRAVCIEQKTIDNGNDKHAMRAPPCLDSCHELCPQLNFLHK